MAYNTPNLNTLVNKTILRLRSNLEITSMGIKPKVLIILVESPISSEKN